jgi:hypothetical protein
VACLRDDLVFFVYLYQRWIYRVDTTRTSQYQAAAPGAPAAAESESPRELCEEKEASGRASLGPERPSSFGAPPAFPSEEARWEQGSSAVEAFAALQSELR